MSIGVDTHKVQHVLVALNDQGRQCGVHHSANTPEGWIQALTWARTQDATTVRSWGIETSGSLGKGFAQALLIQGKTHVCDVSPQRTAQYRRHGRSQDKTDDMDALAIARLLLAEGDHLPQVRRDDVSTELRLLSDHRDNVLAERTRLINQLHAQMLQVDPVYKDASGPLTQTRSVLSCRDLVLPAADRVLQTRLLVVHQLAAQIVRLDAEVAALSDELEQRVRESHTPGSVRTQNKGPQNSIERTKVQGCALRSRCSWPLPWSTS